MKMEVEHPSETLVSIYQTTLHGIIFQYITFITDFSENVWALEINISFLRNKFMDASFSIEIVSILLYKL
jgi:hypothetical protein